MKISRPGVNTEKILKTILNREREKSTPQCRAWVRKTNYGDLWLPIYSHVQNLQQSSISVHSGLAGSNPPPDRIGGGHVFLARTSKLLLPTCISAAQLAN